jgi:hypothetical protein
MGGLITLADPRDLPEGASPRNWDVDYRVGSVYTRPGLVSVYTYASTIQITSYSLGSGGLATFTYTGIEPTENEGWLLSGFQGPLSVLNGQNVYSEAITMNSFMAQVDNGPIGTFINLTATGVSSTGQFVGPNQGVASSASWSSPQNVFSATAYASASGG